MIRIATYPEVQNIYSYHKQLYYEATGRMNEEGVGMMTYHFNEIVTSGKGYYLVCEHDEQIAGWILLGNQLDPLQARTIGFLYELYVFEPYRRKGIARNLILTAIQHLKDMGHVEIALNVFVTNSAKKLYEECGFKDDQIQMSLKLS